MLVLTRGERQTIHIGDAVVTILSIGEKGHRVKIGIEAPREVTILRGEVTEREDFDKGVKDG